MPSAGDNPTRRPCKGLFTHALLPDGLFGHPRLTTGSTGRRIPEAATAFLDPPRAQCGDTPPEGLPRDRVDVVEVHDAITGHTIVGCGQPQFGNQPALGTVSTAITTEPIRAATGSWVSTETGRSRPGVAANQISPRCIGPVQPILGWTPVRRSRRRPGRFTHRSQSRLGSGGLRRELSTERTAEHLDALIQHTRNR